MDAKSLAGVLRGGLLTLALAACGAPAPVESVAREPSLFETQPSHTVNLPPKLREASGLTVGAGGRLFSHNDERAVVREVDPETGAIVKSFHVGDLHGDFEDIATTGDGTMFLLASDGHLLRFHEGADGDEVAYDAFDTGLVDICELEGLAFRAASHSLILACKVMHDHAMRDQVRLYAWSVDTQQRSPDPWMSLPMAALAQAAGVAKFHPSAVQFDPASGRILLLAGREKALVELSSAGTVLTGRRLGPGHPQPEGLAIAADGSMLIVDEGDKNGVPARLTRYLRRP